MSTRAAIVTGAARGIGLAISRQLVADGMAVVLADIDADALDEAKSHLVGPRAAEVVLAVGDVSDQGVAETLVERCKAEFGAVDVLVNNAGGGVILPTLQHTEATLQRGLCKT